MDIPFQRVKWAIRFRVMDRHEIYPWYMGKHERLNRFFPDDGAA